MFARETHARGADLKAVHGLAGSRDADDDDALHPPDLHAMRAAVERWGRAVGAVHHRIAASEDPDPTGTPRE
jgi:hypothetical protein